MAKSKFTKAKEISPETKKKVLLRQNGRSITGAYISGEPSFHHYISRSDSGVGYEWNIVALTFDEHRQYHDGVDISVNRYPRYTHNELKSLIRNHLIRHYSGWSESKCKYKKGFEEKDYEVNNRNKKQEGYFIA